MSLVLPVDVAPPSCRGGSGIWLCATSVQGRCAAHLYRQALRDSRMDQRDRTRISRIDGAAHLRCEKMGGVSQPWPSSTRAPLSC